MPTIIIEGPSIGTDKKRKLVSSLTSVVSDIYEWPYERIIVGIHENPDENIARGGVLLSDKKEDNFQKTFFKRR